MLSVIASFILWVIEAILGRKNEDPVQKGLENALAAKTEEARVMEAPHRPESELDSILLRHAKDRDNSGLP